MQEFFDKTLIFIRRLGLKNQETKIDAISTNVFNVLLIPLFFIHFFFTIRSIILFPLPLIIVNLVSFGVMLVILLLNYFGKHKAATSYLNLVYPFVTGIAVVAIGAFNGLDYAFFVFILTGIFFSHTLKIRIFFTLYNVSIYLIVSQYIILQTSSQETLKNYGYDREILFLMTALCIFAVVNYFYDSIIKHEKHNRELLNNLTQNNTKLSALNQELERFNHIASHDLKTPLRSIMSFSSLIQRDLKKKTYGDVDEYFQFIKNSAKQMNNLITDTLEYTQLERTPTITKEKLDLNKIVKNLSKQIKTSYSANIEINHAPLPFYYGQSSLLISLFQNIFENGIKYNKSETKIINVDFKIHEASLILEIQDNGIGIEQEYLNKIFILFKRLHTSSEFTGTGLGLSICKKIVEQLNGSIWAESEIGKGSTFYISLPFTV